MDRTLTKILLTRVTSEIDFQTDHAVANVQQMSAWTATDSCLLCAADESLNNCSSPGCTEVSVTSSPRRTVENKATVAITKSCVNYTDMFGKGCIDRNTFRYIPHNRMYLKCKMADRVELTKKRRKYGLGNRLTARTAATTKRKLEQRQLNEITYSKLQRHRQLLPLEVHENAQNVLSVNDHRRKSRDINNAVTIKKISSQYGTRDEFQNNGSSFQTGEIDKEYLNHKRDDVSKKYYNRTNCRDNSYDDSEQSDVKVTYHSDDSEDYERSRRRRPPSSTSTSDNQLLKTSSYKFVAPGLRHRQSSDDLPSTQHAAAGQLTSSIGKAPAGTKNKIHDKKITVVKETSYRQLKQQRTNDELPSVQRKRMTSYYQGSRSASPHSTMSSEQTSTRSASSASRQSDPDRDIDWPLHYTQTCLLKDCVFCQRVFTAHGRDDGDDDIQDGRHHVMQIVKTKLNKEDCTCSKGKVTLPVELNLIGRMINVTRNRGMTLHKM